MLSFKSITRMVVVALPCFLPITFCAAQINPEDAPIEDEPIEDVPTLGSTPGSNNPSPTPQVMQDSDTAPANIVVDNTPVTITKSQWESFLARQKQLEDELAALKGQLAKAPGAGNAEDQSLDLDAESGDANTTRPASADRSLLLPDISFIGTSRLDLSSDRRDADRRRFALVKAKSAFKVMCILTSKPMPLSSLRPAAARRSTSKKAISHSSACGGISAWSRVAKKLLLAAPTSCIRTRFCMRANCCRFKIWSPKKA